MKISKITVLGASSALGREILQILAERGAPAKNISAVSADSGLGTEVSYGEDDVLPVHSLDRFDFRGQNAVIAVTPPDITKQAKAQLDKNTLLIDASGLSGTDPDIPLLLAGVKQDMAGSHHIACPSAIAAPLAYVLKPLHDEFKVTRVVVTAMLAAAHMGREGMDELFAQTRAVYMNDALDKEVFPKQIAFNVIPETGAFMPDGAVREEWQVSVDLKRLIDSKIAVSATLTYVPVFLSDSFSVAIECAEDIDAEKARAVLQGSSYLSLIDHGVEGGTVSAVEVAGEDKIYVTRLRDDSAAMNGIQLFITCDTIRAAGAWPAVRLLDKLLKA